MLLVSSSSHFKFHDIVFPSETSNIEVSSLFDSWTSQPGFPIITASEVTNGKVFISQRRFLTGKNSPGIYSHVMK